MAQPYLDVVRRRCSTEAGQWWESVLAACSVTASKAELSRAYTKAARMLGHVPLELDQNEAAAGEAAWQQSFQGRPLHELGRATLLLVAVEALPQAEPVEFVEELFMRGDNAEREALLRTLPLLPDTARFLATAVEACRTNVQTVFEAIACENPYPARYFPELHFNQMVMKALFIGLPLRRIVGLSERLTPTLRQMVGDYVRERTAAGRLVPEDVALILNSQPRETRDEAL